MDSSLVGGSSADEGTHGLQVVASRAISSEARRSIPGALTEWAGWRACELRLGWHNASHWAVASWRGPKSPELGPAGIRIRNIYFMVAVKLK